MSSDIKFSVSMCVYGKDNPQWFDDALDSVVRQTVKPSEIVLVVDGPIPDSINDVIRKYEQYEHFRPIYLERNVGHGEARRIGLENCSNELVALMDADDICVPSRFEQQLTRFSAEPTVDVVGGDIAEFVGDKSNTVAKRVVCQHHDEIRRDLQSRCPMNQMTVMFRKPKADESGGYMDWYCNEDYYLWVRMMQNGAVFANTGTTLVNVRVGADMYNRRGGVRYFRSEARLQRYMLDEGLIGFGRYCINIMKRLIVQVLLPNSARGYIFRKFARKDA